jgi:rare lipoprotein A
MSVTINKRRVKEVGAVCLGLCLALGAASNRVEGIQERGTITEITLRSWDYPKMKKFDVVATAYTAHDEGMDGKGITASGNMVREYHTIATDPKVIPLGTWVYIPYFANTPSKGWYLSEDTGSAIKGMRIDIFMPLKSVALRFGVKPLEIYIFEENDNE